MPDLTVHIPSNAVQDLSAAVAQASGVPLPPTNPEKLTMVQQYTQHQLQALTASYRSQQTGAAAHDATMGENWTTGVAGQLPSAPEEAANVPA